MKDEDARVQDKVGGCDSVRENFPCLLAESEDGHSLTGDGRTTKVALFLGPARSEKST